MIYMLMGVRGPRKWICLTSLISPFQSKVMLNDDDELEFEIGDDAILADPTREKQEL